MSHLGKYTIRRYNRSCIRDVGMAQDDNHKEVHAPLARRQILTYRVGGDISISRFLLISLVIRPLALN